MRPTWDDTWMQVAHVVAERSLCDRAKCGAVIVDAHNRIVSTGYNGPPAGYAIPRWQTDDELCGQLMTCSAWCTRGAQGPRYNTMASYEDCPSLHAELNALSVCDRLVREGGTIYITGYACFSCCKAIANSGLVRVVMVSDPKRDYRNPTITEKYLIDSGLLVEYV